MRNDKPEDILEAYRRENLQVDIPKAACVGVSGLISAFIYLFISSMNVISIVIPDAKLIGD
jgi:hypothetical protein